VITADELIGQLRLEGRVCPLPAGWNALWESLPVGHRDEERAKAPPPLILAAWFESSDLQKRDRFEEHLRWAEKFGTLEKAADFLRALPDADWHFFSDSPTPDAAADSALKSGYFDAWFRCSTESTPQAQGFGIVTPCNPFGRRLGIVENWKRLRLLEEHLRQRSLNHFRVDGGSRDGSHVEPGFGISGAPLADLKQLGAQFNQDAIFWVQDGQVSLVSCATEEVRVVCRWNERQAGMDPMDRLSPARLAMSADDYRKAALVLHTHIPQEPHAPCLFLSGQAVELYLKAFLRACGASEGELKRLSHDLVATFRAAEKAGIRDLVAISIQERALICGLSQHYSSKDLQYTRVGLKPAYPAFASIAALLQRLHQGVRPFANDYRKVHYGRPTAVGSVPKPARKKLRKG
jgi:hypothetical protein